MKILLVWPDYEDTFWNNGWIRNFLSKRSLYPPLGLLTIAAMLPEDWEKRLIDMEVEELEDSDILWADYVFISAFVSQKESVERIIAQSKKNGVKVILGGPLVTLEPELFLGKADHLVLNEAENTLGPFIDDMKNGT
ncbi:MAG TPA: cobalamin B12-binding domain-containing protein, partial [Candidatus Omnitrophota bacterium]|nr:cobalamin B12-binding domain-containing protein [Candidatus Omnitrophota bacterium]